MSELQEKEASADVVYVNDGLSYHLDETGRGLQVLLCPENNFFCDLNCLAYYQSDSLQIVNKSNFWTKLLTLSQRLDLITNNSASSAVAVLGIGQCGNNNGKILPILFNENSNFFIVRDYIISASEQIDIVSKILPLKFSGILASYPQIMNMCEYVTRKPVVTKTTYNAKGVVFLQGSSDIMTKTLKRGECLIVNINCLVGFEEGITLSIISNNSNSYLSLSGAFFRCEGSGKIYFTNNSFKLNKSNGRSTIGSGNTNSLLGLMLHFAFLILFYFSVNLMIKQLNLLAELVNREALNGQ